jgi:hypothetical protein
MIVFLLTTVIDSAAVAAAVVGVHCASPQFSFSNIRTTACRMLFTAVSCVVVYIGVFTWTPQGQSAVSCRITVAVAAVGRIVETM